MRAGDPFLGQTLGDRYQIVRRIARGGMATVFEAVDVRLSRTVAVKVMHPGMDDPGDVAARFDTEARAAALLSHPHVVGVFDQGVEDGRPYIVMEYVRGITLRQLITLEAPFEPARALQLYEPVVAALAHAHDAGLIHRDVKPENVLISEGGQVKVADFGLARPVTAATVAEGGVVIGTVSYIAPELVSRGQASPRSDVYSLGILLYELLTGRKPFQRRTPIEIAYAHVHEDVPAPSASVGAGAPIPACLDDLVHTATARTPSGRPVDAGVLLRQVRGAREALALGVADTGPVRALMAVTSRRQADDAAARLPQLVGAAASARGRRPAAESGTPAPGFAAESPAAASTAGAPAGREIRAMPSNVASPTYDMVDDGPPYFSDGPEPISPSSPPGRPRQAQQRGGWVQTPVHRRRRLAVGLASLAVTVSLVFGGWWVVAGRLPATPPTTGLAQTEAQSAVTGAGLTVQFVREFSESIPAGVATRSDPTEGTRLDAGSTVIVYLSQGPRLFDVPALKGLTRDAALRALTDAGLVAGAIGEAYDDKVAAGSVIGQSVTSGTGLRRGGAVDFVLSRGPEQADLPAVTGGRVAEVQASLTAGGFKVKVTEQYSPTVAAGLVIGQAPAAGRVRKGETVTLTVSKGPGSVAIPDVRRLDVASAVAKLQAAGFVVSVATSPTPAGVPGTVVSTEPSAGKRLTQGQPVTVRVG